MPETSNSHETSGPQAGFHQADHVSEDVTDRLREFFPMSDSLSFRNVMERDLVGGHLLVGELYLDDSSQTIAYFASDVLKMPSFILQPQSRSLYLFSKVLGLQNISFKSHRDFSRDYDLSAAHPDHARLLFNDAVLAYFGRHSGLQVMSDDYRLIIFQPGRRCQNAEVEHFIGRATEVFTLFQEAAVIAIECIAGAPPIDPHRGAAQLTGLAGTLVRRHLVTRQDVDSFLAQPTPRFVPPNIRRQRLGSTSALFAWFGPLIAAGGLATSIATGFFGGGPWNQDRIVPIIVGVIFALVGGLSSFFACRYRFRSMRLLRRGSLASATIESVEATEVYVGYEQQYRARVHLDSGERQWTAECYLDGRAARRARQYIKSRAPVCMLYDPDDRDRVLWTELLIIVSEEYEPPCRHETPTTAPSVSDDFRS
jgi:hypothetical protein